MDAIVKTATQRYDFTKKSEAMLTGCELSMQVLNPSADWLRSLAKQADLVQALSLLRQSRSENAELKRNFESVS